jgi:hypothetical protein
MNEGLFEFSHGAPLEARRVRYKFGQGASQVYGEALVIRNTDFSTPMLRSVGAGAPVADVTDFVLAVPVAAGRGGQAVAAAGGFSLQIPDGGITGGNRRGNGAVDFTTARTTATQVASGANAFQANSNSTASAADSFACCSGIATGAQSFAHRGTASGTRAAVFNQGTASGQDAFACCGGTADALQSWSGCSAWARGIVNSWQWAITARSAVGDRNLRKLGFAAVTTNATVTTLTTNAAAEATSNTWVLPNNCTGVFTGYVVARNTANNDSIAWRVEGMVTRDATAATVVTLGSPTVTAVGTADASMSACVLAVNVNTTNGSLRLQATGIAATTISWNGWIDCAENA